MSEKLAKDTLATLCLLMMAVLTGCHTSKKAYTGDLELGGGNDGDIATMYAQLAQTYSDWQNLYVPVELSLEAPRKMSISGRATLINGSEIYISLRMLGMEVGYLYINGEELYVVDKFHKMYYNEKIGRLLSDYNIGLSDLQNLLLGRAVLPGKGVITEADAPDFNYLTGDTEWIMIPASQYSGAQWHYTVTKTQPPVVSAVSLRHSRAGAMECRFTEATSTPAGITDGVCTLTLPVNGKDIKISVTWMLDDAKWDTDRTVKFSPPPASYKTIDIKSMIESMDNM